MGFVIKESWTGNRPASQPEITVRKGWLSSKSQRLMALRQFSESEMGSVRSPTVLTWLSNGIGVKSLQQRLKRNGWVGCKWRTKRVFTHCRTQRSGAIEATRMGSKFGRGGCWKHYYSALFFIKSCLVSGASEENACESQLCGWSTGSFVGIVSTDKEVVIK